MIWCAVLIAVSLASEVAAHTKRSYGWGAQPAWQGGWGGGWGGWQPQTQVVTVQKVVQVPREVTVPQVVHVRKVISEPKLITVNKVVPVHSGHGHHGWW
uniref:Uncharacterized protein n=1 Tax=Heliothis virescens TaxID=7102 RepID=A0A2A4IXV5_HELVI